MRMLDKSIHIRRCVIFLVAVINWKSNMCFGGARYKIGRCRTTLKDPRRLKTALSACSLLALMYESLLE